MYTSSFATAKHSRIRPAFAILMLAALAASSGCATRGDVDQLRKSQKEVRQIVANYTVALDDVRKRLDALQSSGGGGSRGASDPDVRREIAALELRIAALEAKAAMAPSQAVPGQVPPPAEAPAAPPVAVAPMPNQGEPEAPAAANAPAPAAPAADDPILQWVAAEEAGTTDSEYRAALRSVRGGGCKEAIPALRNVGRKGSKAVKGDHVQYVIGACFYRDRDYNRAIVELYEVLQKYPNGDRVPASLMLLSDSFAASGEKVDARMLLQRIVQEHPGSAEAVRAKQKLQALSE